MQWWQQARQNVANKQFDPLLVEMYRSSMKMSEKFTREYKDFWGLPNEFAF
jgi:acetone carboxylase alpha subunit